MNICQSFLYQAYFMNWILSPAKFICWGPILQCDLFGERVFREASKIKWSHAGSSLIQQDWRPYKKRKKQKRKNPLSLSLSLYKHTEEGVWGGGWEVVNQEENSHQHQTQQHLDLGLLASRTDEKIILLLLLFKPSNL